MGKARGNSTKKSSKDSQAKDCERTESWKKLEEDVEEQFKEMSASDVDDDEMLALKIQNDIVFTFMKNSFSEMKHEFDLLVSAKRHLARKVMDLEEDKDSLSSELNTEKDKVIRLNGKLEALKTKRDNEVRSFEIGFEDLANDAMAWRNMVTEVEKEKKKMLEEIADLKTLLAKQNGGNEEESVKN